MHQKDSRSICQSGSTLAAVLDLLKKYRLIYLFGEVYYTLGYQQVDCHHKFTSFVWSGLHCNSMAGIPSKDVIVGVP